MRGYSLSPDGWLPPVRENEGSIDKRLHCVKLRKKLLTINTQHHQIINDLSESKYTSNYNAMQSNMLRAGNISDGNVSPSLLLSALKNTHNHLLVIGDGKINNLLQHMIFQWSNSKQNQVHPISLYQAISHHRTVVSRYENILLVLCDHLRSFLENPYINRQATDKYNSIMSLEQRNMIPKSHVPVQLRDLHTAVSTLNALTLAHEELWQHGESIPTDESPHSLKYEWKMNDLLLLQKHLADIQIIGKCYEDCLRKILLIEVQSAHTSSELVKDDAVNTSETVQPTKGTVKVTDSPRVSNTSSKTVVFSAVSQGENSLFDIQQLLKIGRDQSTMQSSQLVSNLGFLHELKTVLQHRDLADEIESEYDASEEKEPNSYGYKRPVRKVRNRQTCELQSQLQPFPILMPMPPLQLKKDLDSHIQTQLHIQKIEDTFSDSESDSI